MLVVDDDPLIAELAQTALEDAGFTVTVATNDAAAIAVLEESGASGLIGLITDVRLGCPLSGWDIARKSRELNPGIPVVYMTGDSGHDWTINGVPHSVLVPKPFAYAQLVVALANLVNQSDAKPC